MLDADVIWRYMLMLDTACRHIPSLMPRYAAISPPQWISSRDLRLAFDADYVFWITRHATPPMMLA